MNEEKLCYTKQMLKEFSTIAKSCNVIYSKSKLSIFMSTMYHFLPYCLMRMNENEYLPLNRNYKPIGNSEDNWVNYEDYDFLFLNKNEINLDVLWDNGNALGHSYFLYSDFTSPIQKNNINRYVEILNQSIFLKKPQLDFNYLWSYKKQSDKEGWERNENNQKKV